MLLIVGAGGICIYICICICICGIAAPCLLLPGVGIDSILVRSGFTADDAHVVEAHDELLPDRRHRRGRRRRVAGLLLEAVQSLLGLAAAFSLLLFAAEADALGEAEVGRVVRRHFVLFGSRSNQSHTRCAEYWT